MNDICGQAARPRGWRLCAVWLVAAAAFAQTAPAPAFDVADIKVNTSGSGKSSANLSNGRLLVRNLPLRFLIAEAWTLTPDDIYGPSWLDDVRVDVVARAASPATSDADLRKMVRTLLKERMKMVAHTEQRKKPVLALGIWKGKPKMTPSAMPARPEDSDCYSARVESGRKLVCRHMTMAAFAHELPEDVATQDLGMRIVDRTGLKGAWDFTILYTPQAQTEANGGLTLFAALRAQLGLQLENKKLPVPVVVVDSMAKAPTDN